MNCHRSTATTVTVCAAVLGALAPAPSAGTPDQASVVLYVDGLYMSNGVLIDSEWVLTTATAVDGAGIIEVVLGENSLCATDGTEESFITTDFIVHYNYNPYNPVTITNNIALVRLPSPVTFGPNIQPVCTARGDQSFPGAKVDVTGWWGDTPCDIGAGCHRKSIELDVLANWKAQSLYGLDVAEDQIALVDQFYGAVGPWAQGLGAGAFHAGPDGPVLMGLVGYGFLDTSGCLDPTRPTVFTRVSEFGDWIESYVGSSVVCPAPPPSASQRATVQLRYQGQFTGTGVLVGNDWVLTSAAIVDGRNPAWFEVVAGTEDACPPYAGPFQVRSVDTYLSTTVATDPCGSGFDPETLAADLALIHLSSPVHPNGDVGPIALAPPGNDFEGSSAEIRGWWTTGPCSSELGCSQVSIQQPVIANSLAAQLLSVISGVTFGPCHLATFPTPGSDLPWQHSWGSGAFVESGGQSVLVGIKSWSAFSGTGCLSPDRPQVYTRVSSYGQWIQEMLGYEFPFDLGGGAVPPCGPGCWEPELVTYGGPPAAGNVQFGFEIRSTPHSGLVGLVVGLGAATSGVPWNGGALFSPMDTAFWHWNGFLPVTATGGCDGAATFPLPLPGDPALIGKQLTPQGIFVCPSWVDMVPTNALEVTIQ